MTVNQPTAAPTNKVAAGGVAGALTVILVWVLNLNGVEMPPEVSSALTVIISFGAAYLTKERA